MSMHKIPLSRLEEAGLKAYGLDIGTPSQLSDAFRQGIAWALSNTKLPDYLKLSDDMRAAGDHAEKRAKEDQCYSVPVLKAVFFEAAIQRWLDDQGEVLLVGTKQ